ncbi:hypothetical protein U5N28_15780 [Lysinibacillus telephonicus]|uniref:DUF1269 domain-containing protein n=1 Tax=Lysinibacillus telephonicus TaxID=1714840 RepID=A0A3S0JK58_9BACI|nr:hypothetical protein [Lysinibacillus telephonicus]RTQ87575.1 hypothetical protein EKG35_18920 [Lysinibacillus telephonicus]
MQIFSTFEHSSYLELAITAIEKAGIQKDNILAVPLMNRVQERKLFDTLHRADGISLFDKGAAIGTAFSVIGACVGFVLEWGPIIWGLIGGAIGFIVGFMIDYIFYKVIHKRKRVLKGKRSEVVLVINCPNELVEKVEQLLWDNLALGVAKLEGSE